jgi:hypothetical protein
MPDKVATPGIEGVMLTFDDFVIGMGQCGRHCQPLPGLAA